MALADVAAVVETLPVGWRFVTERERTWLLVFGWALVTTGRVMVDRHERRLTRPEQRGYSRCTARPRGVRDVDQRRSERRG